MSERWHRLPVWARNELERLRRDLESANQKLAAGPANSDTFADAYSTNRRPLGTGTAIEFRMDGPRGETLRLTAERQHDLRGDYLYINAADNIEIRPVAANAMEIRIVRR